MATGIVRDDRRWRAMSQLGLTRVPTAHGVVNVFPSGPFWEELCEYFDKACRDMMAEPEVQAAIRDRERAEMRGEADLLILPWLRDSRHHS